MNPGLDLQQVAPLGTILLLFTAAAVSPTSQAQIYAKGDIVEDFTLMNRATGEPVRLSDFAGRIVFLEWFAWW